MTELETHLLSALKTLEQQFNEQYQISKQGQEALLKMFNRTLQENTHLQQQVQNLSEQVTSLNDQLQQFNKLYNENRT